MYSKEKLAQEHMAEEIPLVLRESYRCPSHIILNKGYATL
jgi:hypothetical protein